MSPHNYDDFDHLEEFNELAGKIPAHNKPRIKNAVSKKQRDRRKDKYNLISEPEVAHNIFAQRDDLRFVDFTYQASRSERWWLIDSLGTFYDERWFDDVLMIVKGGKEASVYQCKGNASTGAAWIAAKVYRPRVLRALRNDTLYKEGRALLDEDGLVVKDHGKLKAVHKGSAFGKEVTHTSWIEHEVRTMQALHAAGLDVPRFYASGSNAILMEYIGDADAAAPALIDVDLDPAEARRLFQRVMRNLEGMLRLGVVHGDLSAYNILYWQGGITLIDFPQAIDPEKNPNGFEIFERDVVRVCEYFTRQGARADGRVLARKFWHARGHHILPRVDPALLDPEDEHDLALWQTARERE
jgi:RIO kinase 1